MHAVLRPKNRIERIHAELERLRVSVEKLPSGAYRLRKGGACHLMVVSLDYLNHDDMVMFAGGPERVQQHAALGGRVGA